MTYKVIKAKIELQCDGVRLQGCNARTQVNENSIQGCLREAKDKGWKFMNLDFIGSPTTAQMAKMYCLCPDCAERRKDRG